MGNGKWETGKQDMGNGKWEMGKPPWEMANSVRKIIDDRRSDEHPAKIHQNRRKIEQQITPNQSKIGYPTKIHQNPLKIHDALKIVQNIS